MQSARAGCNRERASAAAAAAQAAVKAAAAVKEQMAQILRGIR